MSDPLARREVVMSDLDARIKRLYPVGMRTGTDLIIELHCGFELFNTRPYHNYETWSNGWYAKEGGKEVARGETLEELVSALEARGEKEGR